MKCTSSRVSFCCGLFHSMRQIASTTASSSRFCSIRTNSSLMAGPEEEERISTMVCVSGYFDSKASPIPLHHPLWNRMGSYEV